MFRRQTVSNNSVEERIGDEEAVPPLVEQEAASLPMTETAPLEPDAPPLANDLERLRDILYGSQARTTEKRLEALEGRVEQMRRELMDGFDERINTLAAGSSDQLAAVRKELSDRLTRLDDGQSSQVRLVEQRLTAEIQNRAGEQSDQLRTVQRDLTNRLDSHESEQAAQLRTAQQALEARFEEMTTAFLNQVRQTYDELNGRYEQLRQEMTEQLNSLQSESRRRDDQLRQELLQTAGELGQKKVTRSQMAQLMVEMAQRLAGEE